MLSACATRKTSTDKAVTSTAVTDTRVNTALTDITKATPKEVKITAPADSAEAVFKLPKGTRLMPIATLQGRRASVASVKVDTAGILRVKCNCKEEELQKTIYELERTITQLRDSATNANTDRSETNTSTEVIEKKDGPLEWIKERIGGLAILFAILIALFLGLKFAIKGRP